MGNTSSFSVIAVEPNQPKRRGGYRRHADLPVKQRALNANAGTSAVSPERYNRYLRVKNLPLKQRAFFMMKYPDVPPGYIHVRLFASLDLIHRRHWSPTREAVLPLEADGSLDLREIKKLWRLETCIPIDPVRWTPVEPSTPDSLSPISVFCLLQFYNCITFLEPPGSDIPKKEPKAHEKILHQGQYYIIGLYSILQNIVNFTLYTDFTTPLLYGVEQDLRYIDSSLEWRWAMRSVPQKNFLLLIFIVIIALLFHCFQPDIARWDILGSPASVGFNL